MERRKASSSAKVVPKRKGRTVESLKQSATTRAWSLAACWSSRAVSSGLCSETMTARSLAGKRNVWLPKSPETFVRGIGRRWRQSSGNACLSATQYAYHAIAFYPSKRAEGSNCPIRKLLCNSNRYVNFEGSLHFNRFLVLRSRPICRELRRTETDSMPIEVRLAILSSLKGCTIFWAPTFAIRGLDKRSDRRHCLR